MSITSFSQLPLNQFLAKRLVDLNYMVPTAVQAVSLQPVLEGHDLVIKGKTGSGKTLIFALAILNKLQTEINEVQALVLCPTRELADQVAQEIKSVAALIGNVKVQTLCGGVPIEPQQKALQHGAHIVVGTPGRVEEHVFNGSLILTDTHTLVFDEADQMLDMGFTDTLASIVVYVPEARQTLMFSATYPDKIMKLATQYMRTPQFLEANEEQVHHRIKQTFYKLDNNKMRFNALRVLLMQHQPQSCIVFCNTKAETKRLFEELRQTGLACVELHGDLDQGEREWSLLTFANKSANILVATDVAARGLDVDEVELVINYHLALEPQTHIHRVGRTGRGDHKGVAVSLYGEKEAFKVKQLAEIYGQELKHGTLPSHTLLEKPAYKSNMVTLMIEGGKQQKLRKGDIVGCLTGEDGISFKQIGKINIYDVQAFIAVKREAVKPALRKLNNSKIKNKRYKALRA
ncbi:ATP-dependent RNA helicase DbpA [Pseudoalteromonas piscicida]|uniref:ATP-dependent RNA helicase DbpA n=1 Tax=Pseudoalteromonas piscicida TaxID=43662 RepID=A0A2A5JKU5_PSEO7|nr:ATP-dependent RNA helicase DbpA [Pseudoalteromonas piscicida]PCK30060.1 ATP-dependent RNA helicase DbpA [Pseudoalteromonas piscicida]